MLTQAYLAFFRRLETHPVVLKAIEHLLQAMEAGHICLALPTLAQLMHILPSTLQHALEQSRLVGRASDFTPLILDQERLYLARFWFEETQIASLLHKKMVTDTVEADLIKPILDSLFPASKRIPDWQKLAAALAILQPLTVISGGPGTGKTTTLTKLLVAILATGSDKRLIKLAAPTGKAAARMQTAIRDAKAHIPEQFAHLLAYIPDTASTLHRLLHITPLQIQEKKVRLAVDILVVDEASMIDLSMMSILLRSLPEHARLILLGDKNQLASVGPGAIFAGLCAGQGYSSSLRAQLAKMTGFSLQPFLPTSLLSDAIIHLTHSYRFATDSGIGELARMIHQGDADRVCQLLSQDNPQIHWVQDKALAYKAMVLGYQAYFEAAQNAAIPTATVFALWEQFRVLTPLREGVDGSLALNQRISQALTGGVAHRQEWYSGRAVMVVENSPAIGLYNGDIGIVREINNELAVYFADEVKGFRQVAPSRLPQHETAFAMTVHKSQGSEFNEVYCYLPDVDVAVMTRSLFYTAVTRAKDNVCVYGQVATIVRILMQVEQRESGLADRLRLSVPSPSFMTDRLEQLTLFDE